ncbi:S100 calcium binding protein T isoform X2 [Hippocampus zosterae]|uniref:S100 calcium binding protein T isoform X2 n=1 Tax=Hippocampus zosterae TaxID=109293 RepID=UPI00223DF2C5|nr:S100 calcium binding protein T isoform X2 [Hippocampus zosterae]
MGRVRAVFKTGSCSSYSPSYSPLRSPRTLERPAGRRHPVSMSLPDPENASTLENAMQLMIQTFHKYSGNEGDKYTLSNAELKEMLTTELGQYLGHAKDKEAVDKVMRELDSNGDGEVDFTEFIILVGALTVACNDFFLEFNEKPTKKK